MLSRPVETGGLRSPPLKPPAVPTALPYPARSVESPLMLSPTSSEFTVARASENGDGAVQANTTPSKKSLKFLLIFALMCICLSLSALEISSVSTALPTIANALHASQFTWVGSAYAVSSTAFIPMSGGLAQTFGRRPAILIAIGLFALGSGVCGPYKVWAGGGIQSLTGIILADLVTLQERGVYSGLYGLIWCVATSIGPVVGGSLAAQGQWRWLFCKPRSLARNFQRYSNNVQDLNLPICLVACVSVIFLLDLPIPQGGYRDKFMRMDWIGNFLVISSTIAYTIGLTWGGVTASWGSVTVLVPLVLGLVGLGVFIAYDATLAAHPLVSAYSPCTLIQITSHHNLFADYFPVYFQACKGASPVMSGVYSLAFASLAPAAIATGLSVKATRRYRPQIWIGWILIIIPLGLMSTIRATDSLGKPIGCLALLGCWNRVHLTRHSLLSATPMYPIQAPLPVTQNAPALAFMWFLRSFASVWGITVGSTVLQNELAMRLPMSFIKIFPKGTAIMYALIPELFKLPPQIRLEVQIAFADSLAVLWHVLAAISSAGLVVSLFMRGLSLHDTLDADWAMKDEKEDRSIRAMIMHTAQ
ncbi:major facilitator superfamily domain-containing protein [Lanmaoa asiatica]|nr:major facilitator superfamily domain-containing protein [Lanmaoa asiatica]